MSENHKGATTYAGQARVDADIIVSMMMHFVYSNREKIREDLASGDDDRTEAARSLIQNYADVMAWPRLTLIPFPAKIDALNENLHKLVVAANEPFGEDWLRAYDPQEAVVFLVERQCQEAVAAIEVGRGAFVHLTALNAAKVVGRLGATTQSLQTVQDKLEAMIYRVTTPMTRQGPAAPGM